MAEFSWPALRRYLLIVGLSPTILAHAAQLFAQQASGGDNSGPTLMAPAQARTLEPVTDEPNLAPVGPPAAAPVPVDVQSSGPKWRRRPTSQEMKPGQKSAVPPTKRASANASMTPVVETEPGDPAARRMAAQSTSPAGSGDSLILKAYAKSRAAKDEAGYTETIELCREGMHAGLKGAAALYARQLMAWSHNRRGEVHALAGREQQAFEDFDAAVDLDNTAWRAVHNRGVSFAANGKAAEALADFGRAIELNPEFPLVYFNRGEMRYEMGELEGALEDYDTAARLIPGDAEVFNSRGHAHYRLKHFKQAVNDFNTAMRLDPHSAAAHVNRGDVYFDIGYYAEAARDYRDAIRIRPDMGRAYQSAAWLMATCPDAKFRDAARAIDAAERAIELDGRRDYHYLATLAAALANAGKFEAAEKIQRQVIGMAPATVRAAQEKRLALYRGQTPFYTAAQDLQGRSDGQIRNAPVTRR